LIGGTWLVLASPSVAETIIARLVFAVRRLVRATLALVRARVSSFSASARRVVRRIARLNLSFLGWRLRGRFIVLLCKRSR
jgi:hypothetical protein